MDAANRVLAGQSSSGNVDNKEGPTHVTVSGATWVRVAGDVMTAGARLHEVVLVANHSNNMYFVDLAAATSNFAAADARYFQVVTRSFQFLP